MTSKTVYRLCYALGAVLLAAGAVMMVSFIRAPKAIMVDGISRTAGGSSTVPLIAMSLCVAGVGVAVFTWVVSYLRNMSES